MNVTVEIDTATIAEMVNEMMDDQAETAASIERWIEQNGPSMTALLTQSIAETLAE